MIDSSKNKKEPTIDELLDDLQARIDRLKVLYEQYFIGIQKLEPLVPRREIQRAMLEIAQKNIRNTGVRFRFNTLNQKWNVYTTYWNRTCSQIANGTYVRDLARAQRNMARRGLELPDEMKRSAAAARVAEKEKARVEEQMSAAVDPSEPFSTGMATGFDDIDSMFDSIADTSLPPRPSPEPDEFTSAPATLMSPSPFPGARPDDTQRDLPAARGAMMAGETQPGWPDQTVRDLPAARKGMMPEIQPPPRMMPGMVPAATRGPGAAPRIAPPPRLGSLPPPSPPDTAAPAQALADEITSPRTVPPPSRSEQKHRTPRHITRPRMAAIKRPESSPGMSSAPRPSPPRPLVPQSTGPNDAQMRDLYDKYVSAKRANGEATDKVSFESLQRTVQKTASAVSQAHNARAVDFTVAVKDNKVILKATPKK